MAHYLAPFPGDQHLAPQELIRRLQDEFAYVSVDREDGSRTVGDMIAKLLDLRAPQAIIDELMAARDASATIHLADDVTDEEVCLHFTVIPGVETLVGYHSQQHENAARPLLERCARALNYNIRLV